MQKTLRLFLADDAEVVRLAISVVALYVKTFGWLEKPGSTPS